MTERWLGFWPLLHWPLGLYLPGRPSQRAVNQRALKDACNRSISSPSHRTPSSASPPHCSHQRTHAGLHQPDDKPISRALRRGPRGLRSLSLRLFGFGELLQLWLQGVILSNISKFTVCLFTKRRFWCWFEYGWKWPRGPGDDFWRITISSGLLPWVSWLRTVKSVLVFRNERSAWCSGLFFLAGW